MPHHCSSIQVHAMLTRSQKTVKRATLHPFMTLYGKLGSELLQDRGSERNLIQICVVSNDFMVPLLNRLQVCNNGICQSALELAPSHVFDLLSNDILQHCTQPLHAITHGNAGQQLQLQACLKPTWSKLP